LEEADGGGGPTKPCPDDDHSSTRGTHGDNNTGASFFSGASTANAALLEISGKSGNLVKILDYSEPVLLAIEGTT
jgi:hypothetical protein